MSAAFLILALTAAFCMACLLLAVHFCRVGKMARKQRRQPLQRERPDVSVVVTCQNQQHLLQQLLPVLLTQQYEADYEVIVVDLCNNRDTTEWLEAMAECYPHLHRSFCPATARDISRQRLALSLGAKAASGQWLVFLSSEAQLPGCHWLQHLTAFCDSQADAVLGVVRYAEGGGWYGQKVRFLQLWQQLAWFPHAVSHAPYCAHSGLLCYRRSHFLSHQGFASSGLLAVGAEALLVNHNIVKGRCRINLLPEAAVTLPLPTPYLWHRELLYDCETHRHLRHRNLPLFVDVLRSSCFPLYTVCTLVAVGMFACDLVVVSALLSLWVAVVVLQHSLLRITCRALHQSAPLFSLPFLLMWRPLAALLMQCQWYFTDKDIFRKKFV